MPRPKKKQVREVPEEVEDPLIGILAVLNPLIDKVMPIIQKNIDLKAPIIRRGQWMNFTIMVLICVAVFMLAFFEKIDGSAATGLLGAVIGYVFGHIYSKKDR